MQDFEFLSGNASRLPMLYKELNTSEESIQNGVLHLIQWMELQPHLPSIKGD